MNRKTVAAILALLTLSALLVASVAVMAASRQSFETQLIVPQEELRLGPDEAADIAADRIRAMAQVAGETVPLRILSVRAVSANEVASYEPSAPTSEQDADAGPVWIVRAEGTFETSRGRSGKMRVWASGYLAIDDRSGSILGMGMP